MSSGEGGSGLWAGREAPPNIVSGSSGSIGQHHHPLDHCHLHPPLLAGYRYASYTTLKASNAQFPDHYLIQSFNEILVSTRFPLRATLALRGTHHTFCFAGASTI